MAVEQIEISELLASRRWSLSRLTIRQRPLFFTQRTCTIYYFYRQEGMGHLRARWNSIAERDSWPPAADAQKLTRASDWQTMRLAMDGLYPPAIRRIDWRGWLSLKAWWHDFTHAWADEPYTDIETARQQFRNFWGG